MNWTCASGYIQNFLMAVASSALSYWYAVFFEACKERSPTRTGVDFLSFSLSASMSALAAGITVRKTGQYLIPICLGWILIAICAGFLMTLHADSSIAKAVGFPVVVGGGIGMVYVATIFPILASIPVTQSAPAMGLYVFSRNFGSIWGVTMGGAIIQNEVKNKLPASFLTLFPQGVQTAFATIPVIPTLDQPLKDDVRNTFAIALKIVWQIVLGISIVGLLCIIDMKKLKLHTEVDKDWGVEDLPDVRRWSLRSVLPPKKQATDTTEVISV